MTYDAVDRLAKIDLPAVGAVAADSILYTFDSLNNPASMSDADSSIVNAYDLLGRLVQTTQSGVGFPALAINYGYNLVNQRTALVDSGGTIAYAYDALGRLSRLTDQKGRSFGFGYDSLSRPVSTTAPNGIATQSSYDAAGQLLGLSSSTNVGAVRSSAGYSYDLAGLRTTETWEDGLSRSFTYDLNSRISSVSSLAPILPSEAFSFDTMGNKIGGSRLYDAENALTSDDTFLYTYDVEGNMTRRSNRVSGESTDYTYDALNRLVKVTTGARAVSYRYDALGRRIAKTVDGSPTRYLLDGQNVRLEFNGSNVLIAANTHAGLDALLVRDDYLSNANYFVSTDGLGSTTALTDSAGVVIERYRYTAFGKLSVLAPDGTSQPTPPLIPYTYSGREWEPEVGLYFNRARFYDPALERWLSRDPIQEEGGLNLYAYVGNSPINHRDPSGLFIQGVVVRWSAG